MIKLLSSLEVKLECSSRKAIAFIQVHVCLDYTLMNYSHLEYRRLDDKDFWTTPIGLLGHLDYTQNKLHCNLTNFDSAMYFHMKTLKKTWEALNKWIYKKGSNDLKKT